MKKLILLALGLTLVAGLSAGCGSKSNPSQPSSQSATPTPEDIAQVNRVVSSSPAFINDDVYEGTEASQLEPSNGAMAAIRPLFWWRRIDSSMVDALPSCRNGRRCRSPHSGGVLISFGPAAACRMPSPVPTSCNSKSEKSGTGFRLNTGFELGPVVRLGG